MMEASTSKGASQSVSNNEELCREPRPRRAKLLGFHDVLSQLDYIYDSDISDISSDEESVDVYQPPKSDSETENIIAGDSDNETIESETVPVSEKIHRKPVAKTIWKKSYFIGEPVTFHEAFGDLPFEPHTPRQYFKSFVTTEMLEDIAQQSNTYSFQKSGVSMATTVGELEKVIGMFFRMGLIQMPRIRVYWEKGTRCDLIADIMPRNRFEKLIRHIHFVDNNSDENEARQKKEKEARIKSSRKNAPIEPNDQVSENDIIPTEDRCWRIRPFLTQLRANFLKISEEKKCSVDEILVPFRGRSTLKQYMQNKPHCKWGLKLWGRAGESGILYDYDIYQGKRQGFYGDQSGYLLGLGAGVTIQLASTMPPDGSRLLITDNYFTGIDLVKELTKRNIYFIGTANERRLRNCKLKSEREMKAAGRGTVDCCVTSCESKELVAVKWFDNRQCILISNFVGEEPKSTVKRWDKKNKKYITVECPAIIPAYNRSMGGVDLLDNLTYKYKFEIRCNRWYMYIFGHLIQVSAVNSWLLYKRHSKETGSVPDRLRIFLADLATSLIFAEKKRPGRPSLQVLEKLSDVQKKKKTASPEIPKDVRLDGIEHWPIWQSKRNRCRICKVQNTFISCEKCGTYLCLNKERNCFKIYHM